MYGIYAYIDPPNHPKHIWQSHGESGYETKTTLRSRRPHRHTPDTRRESLR